MYKKKNLNHLYYFYRLFTYSIFVRQATEKNDALSSSNVSVVIFPEDVNDNKPSFRETTYVIKVGENTPIGTAIYREFVVDDADTSVSN